MNYAYLRVETDDIEPDDITAILGRPRTAVDSVAHLGDGMGVYDFYTWRLDLVVPGPGHFGTEEQPNAIAGLGVDVAAGCRSLRHRGADITLQVVQEVRGEVDIQATGLHLTHDAIAWLAAAGAELDIDQYFFAEGAAD